MKAASAAMPAALKPNTRARARGVGAVRKVSASITAQDTAKWNQAPREKLSSSPTTRMPTMTRSLMVKCRATMRSMTISAGQIRNGPNTLGSLKAPSARSKVANRSWACGNRLK